MTTEMPPTEGNDARPTSNDRLPAIHPMAALLVSTTLAAITGFLIDWNTALPVFLAAITLFTNGRKTQ